LWLFARTRSSDERIAVQIWTGVVTKSLRPVVVRLADTPKIHAFIRAKQNGAAERENRTLLRWRDYVTLKDKLPKCCGLRRLNCCDMLNRTAATKVEGKAPSSCGLVSRLQLIIS